MSIYSKNGDKGITNLTHTKNVSKSDDRIQLVGTIEELTSHIGLVKTMLSDREIIRALEKIQETLMIISGGVEDPYNHDYKLNDDKTAILEEEIDRLEGLFEYTVENSLPGVCRLSAEIDVTRSVARRAERALASVSVKFGTDTGAKKYMNRLADYLYVLGKYTESLETGKAVEPVESAAKPVKAEQSVKQQVVSEERKAPVMTGNNNEALSEALIQEVLKRMGMQGRITLNTAKRLIDKIEEEAIRRGKKAAIAICGPDGNPVAVHVMDGAFLVGFDAAMKKAYTAVAVQMSTKEFGQLAQPGATFFGADKLDNGKIIIFGGGVPIKMGDAIIGGIGISGGSGEDDHDLAAYGASVISELL